MSLPALAMHLPDGFLSDHVAFAAGVGAVVPVALALRVADRRPVAYPLPLVGAVGAFVFAAQALNFPVAGGTSGHVLGATLAAVLLGPWTACLVLTGVLTVQALVFADGGLTALGANVLNMAVLGTLLAGLLVGGAVRRLSLGRAGLLGLVGLSAWLAVMVGATATSVELALSGTVPLGTVLPAMLGVHALIGAGEAVATVLVVGVVLAVRPEFVTLGGSADGSPPPAARAEAIPGVVRRAS